VTISEPMTLATDYLLGAVTAWLCVSLWKQRESQRSRLCWTIAFGALALGALLGGTWHGLLKSGLLWKATVLTIGVASFAMLVATAIAVLSGTPRTVLLMLAGVKFLVYATAMLIRDEFIVFVIDSGVTFAVVAALHLWRFNSWILAGLAVSVIAALAQASGAAPHRYFNHNDLYHVIQIGAMVLFYRGARRLTDSGALG
jgi:hypothetical protein